MSSFNMLKMRFLLFPIYCLFSLVNFTEQTYSAIASAAENVKRQVIEWQRNLTVIRTFSLGC